MEYIKNNVSGEMKELIYEVYKPIAYLTSKIPEKK